MKKIILVIVSVLVILPSLLAITGNDAFSAIRTDHPRIWLTPEFKATLIDRYNRNTPTAQSLSSWCDNNINDDIGPYIDARCVSLLNSINYALMYQLTEDTRYAQRAVDMIEYAFDHPYGTYTINTWIDFNNFYTDRYLVPATALVFDWCYDWMSSTQRTRFSDLLDFWANRIIAEEPWGYFDPSNNYYYGHALAILSAGYAIHGHGYPDADRYIETARDIMLVEGIKYTRGEQIAWATMDNTTGRSNGGIWNEGTAYGNVNNDFIFSCIAAVQSAETGVSYDFLENYTFPEEVIKFTLFGTYPEGDHFYSEGEAGLCSTDPKLRVPVLMAIYHAKGITDPNIRNYGQYWVENITVDWMSSYKMYHEFIWYDDQLPAINYSGNIPDYYYADGGQTLFWREGWGANDCWMAFRIGLLNSDHAHSGIGNFIISKGGYLARDKSTELNEAMLYSDSHHNLLFIPPNVDKKLYWGASEIDHLVFEDEYLYFSGDMTDVFLAQPSYRENTVAHKEREFFLLKNEKVIAIMDRGTTFDTGVDKVFQIYIPDQYSNDINYMRTSNGNADLLIHTAYPRDGVSSQVIPEEIPRLEIKTSESRLSKTFLHTLKVTDPNGVFNVSHVISSINGVVATAFQSGSNPWDYMISFSNDPEGDPPGENSFSLTYSGYSGHLKLYMLNMQDGTDYYVAGTIAVSSVTVTVSKNPFEGSSRHAANAEGMVIADIYFGEDPLPTPVPNGIGIESGNN